jgi:hypothetical protein
MQDLAEEKKLRGFGTCTYHKNGTPRVERYFVCSMCLDEKSIRWSYMLPHSKEHKDRDYQFPCCTCKKLTRHHDIGHLPIEKDLH